MYKTLRPGSTAEFTEKKSVFVSNGTAVTNTDQVHSFLKSINEAHPNVAHHAFAYRIGQLERFNDAGEPNGTAGMPILNVIKAQNLDRCIIVVSRYFGGILLGAGGLVRAYGTAAKLVTDGNVVTMAMYDLYTLKMEYQYLNKLQHQLPQMGIEPVSIEYTDSVLVTLSTLPADTKTIYERAMELTSGQAIFTKLGEEERPLPG